MAIPEGWKLVPIIPTEKMIQAGCGEGDDIHESVFIRAYDAALDAAPTPTAEGYEDPDSGQWVRNSK